MWGAEIIQIFLKHIQHLNYLYREDLYWCPPSVHYEVENTMKFEYYFHPIIAIQELGGLIKVA